jgi:hypothetical protein
MLEGQVEYGAAAFFEERRGLAYRPEALNNVEVDIVLGDFVENTEVALCLVKGQGCSITGEMAVSDNARRGERRDFSRVQEIVKRRKHSQPVHDGGKRGWDGKTFSQSKERAQDSKGEEENTQSGDT